MTLSQLQQSIATFRQQLAAREQAALRTLADAHAHTVQVIQARMQLLYDAIEARLASGETIPVEWVLEHYRMYSLEQLVSGKINDYGAYARHLTALLQADGVTLGSAAAQALLTATVPAGVAFSFGVPSQAALQQFVGATQIGSPLADLFNGFGAEAAQAVKQTLLTGLTLGHGPREVAESVAQDLTISQWRAQTIARTEMNRAYRGASLATYQANSDVVSEWRWTCALSARSCAACLGMDGETFPIDEPMDSHPNCFPAGTVVSGPRVVGSTARWYVGEIVDIELASGNLLSVTPNHPILTPKGWIAAGLLDEGSNVICYNGRHSGHPPTVANPDDYQVETTIEQVSRSFGEVGSTFTRTMPTAPEDFHGDGSGSQVYIVRAYRQLRKSGDVALSKPFSKQQLCWRHAQLLQLARLRSLHDFLTRLLATSRSVMSSVAIAFVIFRRALIHHETICSSLVAYGDVGLLQSQADNISRNTQRLSDGIFRFASSVTVSNLTNGHGRSLSSTDFRSFDSTSLLGRSQQTMFNQGGLEPVSGNMASLGSVFDALSGEIGTDCVVKKTVRAFSGHVYNLQTTEHWYIANTIITHNCRCTPVPITKSWADILGDSGIDTSGLDDSSITDDMPTGADWFAAQPASVQQDVLGKAKYQAYADGKFQLSDVVGHSHDAVWGGSIYERSLADTLKAADAAAQAAIDSQLAKSVPELASQVLSAEEQAAIAAEERAQVEQAIQDAQAHAAQLAAKKAKLSEAAKKGAATKAANKAAKLAAEQAAQEAEQAALLAQQAAQAAETLKEFTPFAGSLAEKEQFLRDNAYGPWMDSLSVAQRKQVQSYTGGIYRDMNTFLRTGVMPPGSNYTQEDLQRRIDLVQSALLKSSAPTDLINTRGCGNSQLAAFQAALSSGEPFVEKGFCSTTILDKPTFSGARMIIQIPEGSPGAYIAPVSNYSSEQEYLLPYGAALRIYDGKQIEGKWTFFAEYVGIVDA